MDLSNVQWRKSSRSGYQSNCVKVAAVIGRIFIRDSKTLADPTLSCNQTEWAAFLDAAKNGDFDLR